MFEMIQSGGVFMYVILGVSVMSFALFFERAGYLYLKLKLNTDKAAKKIMIHLENSNYRAAKEECTRIEKHPLGRILKAGLLKSDKNFFNDSSFSTTLPPTFIIVKFFIIF